MLCILGLSLHGNMELVTLQRSKSAHKIHVNKLFQKAREILNSEDQDAKEKVKIKVSLPAKLEKILKVNEDIPLALCLNSEVDKEDFSLSTSSVKSNFSQESKNNAAEANVSTENRNVFLSWR